MAEVDPQILGEHKREINKELLTILPLWFLSIVIPIVAWNGVLQCDEDVSIWFQRSGSLMVLFSVWAEYKLFKISELTSLKSKGGIKYQDFARVEALNDAYDKILNPYKLITAILAIIGTVIWGYGDIFMKYTQSISS